MSFTWFRTVFLAGVAVFFVFPSCVFSQMSHVVSGRIHDAETGETLIGASIRLQGADAVGTRTNNYGFFSLTVETGMQVLVFSHVGYQTQEIPVNLTKDTVLNVNLGHGE